MGLEEHIKAGAQLTRDTIAFTAATGSGVVDLGPAYAVLKIQTGIPARLRLYDREDSRDDPSEISRPFGIYASTSIALVGDFSMSAEGTYTISPAIFGFSQNRNSPQTFYRIENAIGQPSQSAFRITRFLLEDKSILPDPETFYTVDNRQVISIEKPVGNMGPNEIISGTLASVPRTFMLISASLENPSHKARVRFYATSSAIYDITEKTRPFSVEPSETVELLADIMISSGSYPIYFTPKLFSANLENMGNDLEITITDAAKIDGNPELYYYFENLNPAINSTKVNIAIYSLED